MSAARIVAQVDRMSWLMGLLLDISRRETGHSTVCTFGWRRSACGWPLAASKTVKEPTNNAKTNDAMDDEHGVSAGG